MMTSIYRANPTEGPWELRAPDGRLSYYPALSDLYRTCAALLDYQDELIVTLRDKARSLTGAQLKHL